MYRGVQLAVKKKLPFRAISVLALSFCLFENDALAQRRVELYNFNLTFDGLLILPRPDDMVGLRRLEPEQAVL